MTILQVLGSLDNNPNNAERLDNDDHLPGTLAKITGVQRALEHVIHVSGTLTRSCMFREALDSCWRERTPWTHCWSSESRLTSWSWRALDTLRRGWTPWKRCQHGGPWTHCWSFEALEYQQILEGLGYVTERVNTLDALLILQSQRVLEGLGHVADLQSHEHGEPRDATDHFRPILRPVVYCSSTKESVRIQS